MNKYEIILKSGKKNTVSNPQLTKHIEVTSIPVVVYYRFSPNLTFEGEKHNLYEFFLCLKGQIKALIEDKEYILNENEYIIMPKDKMHSNVPNNSYTSSIAILFDAENLKDNLILSKVKKISSDETSLVKLITKNYYNNFVNIHYTDIIQQQSPLKNEYAHKQIIKNALEILLLMITRDFMHIEKDSSFEMPMEENTSCKKVKEYIDNHIYDNLTLKNLAKKFFYSESYLSRLFKSTYNETVVNYINKTKIKESAKILYESNKSIQEISDMFGFTNTQYFIKLFKKYYGYTPAKFRKESRITNILNALNPNDEAF